MGMNIVTKNLCGLFQKRLETRGRWDVLHICGKAVSKGLYLQTLFVTPLLRALGISQCAKSPEICNFPSKPDNGPVASPTMCDCRSTG